MTAANNACEVCWRVDGAIRPAVRWVDDATGEARTGPGEGVSGLCAACARDDDEPAPSTPYTEGWDRAEAEIRADRWTPARAQEYLAACKRVGADVATGRDERDRGFMARVRALAVAP